MNSEKSHIGEGPEPASKRAGKGAGKSAGQGANQFSNRFANKLANRGDAGRSVRLVVVALILRGREVLICQRRPDQPMALKWEFPGGKMEPGESAEEALARELDEELGIAAKIGARVTRTRHTYRSGSAVDLQFFAVHEFGGEITNRIFNDMKWCELTDLPSYDFLAADRGLVRDLAAGKLL